jgi:peptidoglycan/LPS O-acetylase OafA/YrhL
LGKTQTSSRDLTLDAWRAVLILSVMVFHYTVRWAPPFAPVDYYRYSTAYPPALEVLRYAVHIFFVISGVVITMTLYRCKGPLDFAFRRFARLFPVYVVAASVSFVLTRLFLPDFAVSFTDYLKNLTMLAANFGGRYVDGVFWSLAVEVKFYFWMAISYWLLKDRFWVGAIAVAVAGMVIDRVWHGFADKVLIQPYVSFFLWGIALRLTLFEKKMRAGLLTAIVGLIAYALNWQAITLMEQPSLIANLFVLAMVGVFVVTIVVRTFALPFLALLGRWSYALYLIHENIGLMIIRALKHAGAADLVAQVCAALGCIGASALLFYLLERPTERWLRSVFAKLQTAAAALLAPRLGNAAPGPDAQPPSSA